jgi:RNase adapter protein RapZ
MPGPPKSKIGPSKPGSKASKRAAIKRVSRAEAEDAPKLAPKFAPEFSADRKPAAKSVPRLVDSPAKNLARELVIVTGMSGSGKASALKAFEDLGFYAVDNLPLELLPDFATLVLTSNEIERAVIVVDVREGPTLDKLPAILLQVKKTLHTSVVFLEANDAVLVRRFSETRRPHPLSRSEMVARSITSERQMLEEVRNLADFLIDTSGFNVHELRAYVQAKFGPQDGEGGLGAQMLVTCLSFGFKNGVPLDADLVFDVRFLPNPHFIPEFRKLTGRNPKVAKYVRDFPQTVEFLERVTGMMLFLLPHYVKEGKSYLTIAFGCTGGQHRSVMMAEEMAKRLGKVGYRVKALHRDMPR